MEKRMLGGASSSFLFSPSFLSFLQHPLLFTFPCSFCSLHNQPLTDSPPLYSRIRSQFPQFLHFGRFDEIRKLWLSGQIPTFVSRKLEAATDHGGWTTF
jgi:hypothetical protein